MAFESVPLVEGEATGPALRLDEPLSFWGGLDPKTGMIIDGHHPQAGESVSGRVVVMSHGRGSSSSTQVLTEALRLGHGPLAVVMSEPDVIVMLGALVADYLYGLACPVVVIDAAELDHIETGSEVSVTDLGRVVTVDATRG